MNQHVLPRSLTREQESKFGTQILADGVRFRLWAPGANAVSVKIFNRDRIQTLLPVGRGWFEAEVEGVGPGDLYKFVLEDGTEVPDPASRFQPDDVDGPSEVIDPRAYEWSDLGWRGRPWEETVFYELHVGTFTPEGTFRAVIDKLDALVELGVTAIELLPLADFRGRWNWGYDGALLFAPDSTYGRPEDLKALVDAAHARGLMVFLDVVYNHFGPKGNYLNIYAPVVTEKHQTPWGPAVNFDDDGSHMIRDFVHANARYWLNEFRFDGLRFDAVHAIVDAGPKHMLQDVAEQIRASTDGRHVHLVVENSANHADWMKRREDGTPSLYTAQWSDDIHHGLHCAVTGEDFWYYADFAGRTDIAARALAEGLGWQGEWMEHEQMNKGEPSAYLPATAFVSYIQNHDQTGNRAGGERITDLVPPQAVRAITAINLLSPHIPLIFMGEEWAASQPFMFFTDMGDDLADIIRNGRKDELKNSPPPKNGVLPDPLAEETFRACKLDWAERQQQAHADYLSLYKRLLAVRQREIVPRLYDLKGHSSSWEMVGARAFRVRWTLGDGSELTMIANLSPDPLDDIEVWADDHLWLEGFASGNTLEAWSVVVRLTPPGAAG